MTSSSSDRDRVSAEPPVGTATGFWRLERPAGAARTWLFGPDGHAVFLLGVNTVMRGGRPDREPSCARIGEYIRRHDPTTAAHIEWARLSDGRSGGQAVPRPYGFNSVGAFSDRNDFDDSGGDSYMIRPTERGGAGAPYTVVLNVGAGGNDRALRNERGTILEAGFSRSRVGDPFNPAFAADLDASIEREVAARRTDPQLQMWFADNEIGMFDVGAKKGGVRDFRRWIWSSVPAGSSIERPRCARHALAAFLRELYDGSIDTLNRAWNSAYPDFSTIVERGPRPVPGVHDCNRRCGADLQRFVHDRLLGEWVRVVTRRIRAADPNHLIGSPRLAIANPDMYRFWNAAGGRKHDHWTDAPADPIGKDTELVRYSPFDLLGRDGDTGFDLIAINAYTKEPRFPRPWFTDGLHKLQQESGLPVLISEFGIRTKIDGWTNRGGAGAWVPSRDPIAAQRQRGQRYELQIEQFISFRHVVGAVWHAWSDRYKPKKDPDHPKDPVKQINLGLVQCADAKRGMSAGDRWNPLDELVANTNRTIIQRVANKTGL